MKSKQVKPTTAAYATVVFERESPFALLQETKSRWTYLWSNSYIGSQDIRTKSNRERRNSSQEPVASPLMVVTIIWALLYVISFWF